MMEIQYRRRKPPEYKVLAREIIRVLNERPHLMVRVEVSGEHFPHRAPHPFVMIRIDQEKYFEDLFTEVSPDNQKLMGYLPVDIPATGVVVFGYGDEIWGTVPGEFYSDSVVRLDREKIPKETVIVDHDYLRRSQ